MSTENKKQVTFEPGASFACSKCGKVVRRRGPFNGHVRACRGPKTDLRACPNCGEDIAKRSFGGHRTQCLGKNPLANPEVHRRAMETRSANPNYRAHLSERMTKKNLSRSKESRDKMTAGFNRAIAEGRIVPFGRGLGGKGKPPHPTEEIAAEILIPLGFTRPYTVTTGRRGKWYSLDFAMESLLLDVEIDGSSHWTAARKAADAERDQYLVGQGWAVVRIPAHLAAEGSRWLSERLRQSIAFPPGVTRFSTSK